MSSPDGICLPPSFEDLAAELNLPLTRYLRGMVGNPADADDLLQETLIRIAGGLSRFEGRSSLKTWAYRIAANVAIDYIRKNRKATLVEFNDEAHAPEEDNEDRVVIDEMNECIRGVIEGLPPDYRSAIILSDLEGRSIAEISEILRISVSATKVRIHRARARLKQAIAGECEITASADGTIKCDPKSGCALG